MSHESQYTPKMALTRWLDARLPVVRLMSDSFITFPTPRNLNYWWTFGAILAFCLAVQLVTGIILAMHYTPQVDLAWKSVEHIMRDVNYGWLFRYTHAVGAALFFFAAFVHLFRGLYYGSYKSPREIPWIIGVVLLILMIATAFMGYSLVWGQMSYWAVTVISGLVTALDSIVPNLGTNLQIWILGGFSVDNATLNRLFSAHYLLPFIIAAVVVLHIWAFHVPGNNNPTGVEIKTKKDTVPFHPFYTVKDLFAIVVFMLLFAYLVFYMPNYLGHADNYIPADRLKTPADIVPEWYFLPFYAILRAIPSKLFGVLALGASLVVLFFVPWLDTSRTRSGRFRPLYRIFFWLFVITCIGLGFLGGKAPEGWYLFWGRIFTAYYFAFFLVVMPVLGLIERPKPEPKSITEAVEGPQSSAGPRPAAAE
jgi:ubiquinol-cytochrome c reductase cytochrome b/c1 subunit